MKPAIEFLKELPDGYRELALEAVEKWPLKPGELVDTMPSAICSSFVINGRNEIKTWVPFWYGVIDHYLSGLPLPPLPPLPAEYYWKRRCEAAEKVIEAAMYDDWSYDWNYDGSYNKWQELKNQQI